MAPTSVGCNTHGKNCLESCVSFDEMEAPDGAAANSFLCSLLDPRFACSNDHFRWLDECSERSELRSHAAKATCLRQRPVYWQYACTIAIGLANCEHPNASAASLPVGVVCL